MLETIALHQGEIHARPNEVDFESETLRRLNRHYSSLIAKGMIQGASYALSRYGKTFAHAAMGKLTHKDDSPDLQAESIRKTYSITKMITAIAIMQLCERGLIQLHQPVYEILKPFDTTLHRGITVFHLVTHTSGLRPDGSYYLEPYHLPGFGWAYRERKKIDPTTDWVQILLSGPLASNPGKEWNYSTAGFVVLGEIIKRVSGIDYHLFIEREILKPLGMNRSGFIVPPENRAETCVTNDWEEAGLSDAQIDPVEPPRAGGGMYSTLADLIKLGRMLLEKGSLDGVRILSPRSVELMTQNRLSGVRMKGWGNDFPDFHYGLGVSFDKKDLCTPGTFSHEGHGPCGLYLDPVEQLAFAFYLPSNHGYSADFVHVPMAIVWSGLY